MYFYITYICNVSAAVSECGSSISLVNEQSCNSPAFMDPLCVAPLPAPPTPPPVTTTTQPGE